MPILAALFYATLYVHEIQELAGTGTHQTRPLPAAPDSSGTFAVHHRWKGPIETYGENTRFTCDIALEYSSLREMAETFGIPKEWLEAEELAKAKAEVVTDEPPEETVAREERLIRRAAHRGVRLSVTPYLPDMEPDYDWIVEHSREDMAGVADAVQDILRERHLETQRDLIRIVSSLVQSIEYAIPDPVKVDRTGREVLDLGIATPIEVLHNLWGDCDSKTLLFASILENFEGQSIVLLRGENHLFAGVRMVPRRGDCFVTVQGVPYVLVELTGLFSVGSLPRRQWNDVRRNRYEVLPL